MSGAFRTVGGTVIAVNEPAGELKVKELNGSQELTVSINKDSLAAPPCRRKPRRCSQQRAMGGGGGPVVRRPWRRWPATGQASGGAASAGGGAGSPEARLSAGGGGLGGGAGGPGRWRPAGGRGGFDLQEVLGALCPQTTLAELEARRRGDVFQHSWAADPSRATPPAITMVAGLEPLAKMMQSARRAARDLRAAGPGRQPCPAQTSASALP
ncbi:MAG: hypothetical protein WKF84_21535 [Pyrinomonadaceae bacterium]